MKKINLSKPMLNLDGTAMYPNEDSSGNVLANYLMSISTTDAVSKFKIAADLLTDKEIEVTEDDFKMLLLLVDQGNMSNIMKARIINGLNGD